MLTVWVRFTSKLQFERDPARLDRTSAVRQRIIADAERDRAKQHLYQAEVNLAQQAWQDAQIPRLFELLKAQIPARQDKDLRGCRRR